MKFDYMATLSRFWKTAPTTFWFRPIYAAFYAYLLYRMMEQNTNTIQFTYRNARQTLKLSRASCFVALQWLYIFGFIKYRLGALGQPHLVTIDLIPAELPC